MDSTHDYDNPIDLPGYVSMLRRRWWMLVLIPVLIGTAVYAFTVRRDPSYSATATLLVTQASSLGVTTSNDIQAAGLLTQTYAQLVSAPEVLEVAAPNLADPISIGELLGHVEARANPLTQLISVEATYEDPAFAADVANATAQGFVTWLAEREIQTTGEDVQALQEDIDQARDRVEETSTELTELRTEPGDRTSEEDGRIAALETLLGRYEATYASLLDIQNRLTLAKLAAQGQVSVVTAARAPGSPNGYPAWVYTALATLFGLGVAGLAIVSLEAMDRRIRSPRDVYRAVGLPVLGLIPKNSLIHGGVLGMRSDTLPAPTAEAFRSLRTRFQFTVNGRGMGTIAVLRPGRGGQRSTVASNLAAAFAEQGRRVVILDGASTGQKKPRSKRPDVGHAIAASSPNLADRLEPGPHPSVWILPLAQEWPGRSATPLTREDISDILTAVKQHADVVIISPPPIEQASDSLLLAGAADDAVIVAEAGVTPVESLQKALEDISITPVNVLGVVLNGVTSRERAR